MKDRDSYDYVLIGLILRLLANVKSSTTKELVVEEMGKLKKSLINAGYGVSVSNLSISFYSDMEKNS